MIKNKKHRVSRCFLFDFDYAKKVISLLTIIVTRSIIQNIGQRKKLRIAPNQAPLWILAIIPKSTLVNGIIAKIKQTIQLRPKYLFALAIMKSPYINFVTIQFNLTFYYFSIDYLSKCVKRFQVFVEMTINFWFFRIVTVWKYLCLSF